MNAILEGMMNNSHKANEHISAFADGELDTSLHDSVLKLLRDPKSLSLWDDYHCIGDVLRSSEAGLGPGANFSSRITALLAEEPIHLKSEECSITPSASLAAPCDRSYGLPRGLAVPGAAIAATVILALSSSMNIFGDPGTSVASNAATLVAVPPVMVVSEAQDGQIDDYLLAHQRVAPSLYTTAHYARFSNSVKE